MDEKVIAHYRRLLREDFPNSGEMENPSVFLEAVGEKLINCGNTGNFMHLYLRIEEEKITGISYQCSCEPVANVAIEVLCELAKGKALSEVQSLSEEDFLNFAESRDERLRGKVEGVLALFRETLSLYRAPSSSGGPDPGGADPGSRKPSWDEPLSP